MSPERRAWPRHPCGRLTAFRSSAAPPHTLWVAVCRDLSAGGVGLLTAYPSGPPARLTIELPAGAATHTLQARVVHATPLGAVWLLGCAFDRPLGGDVLRGLRDGADG